MDIRRHRRKLHTLASCKKRTGLFQHPKRMKILGTIVAQQRRMLVSAIKTIVFSAMATEAAIFDLGAIHLGDSYARQNLDRLDLVAKWIIVPKLICGTSLDTNGPGIQTLRELVKARNALVHHKSWSLHDPDAALKKGERWSHFGSGKTFMLRSNAWC